jgi:hypothetical protein
VFEDPDMEEEEVLPLVCFPESPNNNSPIHLQYILYPIGKWLRHNFTVGGRIWVFKTLSQAHEGIQ